VVTLDAGYCSLSNASLMVAAGYSYVLALKENQPELLREAQRVLLPLAATQRPEAKVLDRDHSQWVRRSLWWRAACTGWLEWTHLQQVWLMGTEKFARQTSLRADSPPGEVEDHYYIPLEERPAHRPSSTKPKSVSCQVLRSVAIIVGRSRVDPKPLDR